METNRYYQDHLDRLDEGPSSLHDKIEAEMLVFLVITIQMGHCIRTDRLLQNEQPIPYKFLQQRYETGQISAHPSHSALHKQQEWAWHDRRKFWQVMENMKSIWISKQYNIKILQPLRTSGHGQSYCFVQRKGLFLTIHTQETQTINSFQPMRLDWLCMWYDNLYFPWQGKEIFYRDLQFTLVKDILETKVQVVGM